jgi:hypothetical protein
MEVAGKPGHQIPEHEGRGRETVQQEKDRRAALSALSIKNPGGVYRNVSMKCHDRSYGSIIEPLCDPGF